MRSEDEIRELQVAYQELLKRSKAKLDKQIDDFLLEVRECWAKLESLPDMCRRAAILEKIVTLARVLG